MKNNKYNLLIVLNIKTSLKLNSIYLSLISYKITKKNICFQDLNFFGSSIH